MARWRELTYRTEPVDKKLVGDMARRLTGQPVVIWLVKRQTYKRAYLVSVDQKSDCFRVRWSKKGTAKRYRGIWRVHNAKLFSEKGLPKALWPAKLPDVTNNYPRGVSRMAAKATSRKRTAKAEPTETNGGRTRSRDILEDYTEAERKRLAKAVLKMKKNGAKWGEIGEELDLPGDRPSVAGRRLLREYTDDGEEYIRVRETKPAAKAPTKKRGRKVVEEVDDEEDEDLEEEEEDEAPPRRARKVRATRGRKAANPS